MPDLAEEIRSSIAGDVVSSDEARTLYSHDASLFEMQPEVIVYPKDAADVCKLVDYVNEHKKGSPDLSLTGRGSGTDMSGGAINNSIIVDFKKYFTTIELIDAKKMISRLQPGVMFKDLDDRAKKKGILMPTYPASRDLCTVGGMVANNAGGEKSIEYGKAEDFVNQLEFVFADGIKRTVKPLGKIALDKKMKQKDFEGKVYREIFKLVDDNYDAIKKAQPNVSKDSTGYHLWRVWDRKKGIFDLTQVIVGSQGTLGFVTGIEFKMTTARTDEGLLVVFMKDTKPLGKLIEAVVAKKPSRFESFDDNTLLLSVKFMPKFLKFLGPRKFIQLLISLIPDVLLLLQGVPRLILMVSIKGNGTEDVARQIRELHHELKVRQKELGISGFEEASRERQGEKFWIMRRYSFQILRSSVKDKHAAPFIDDFIVPPQRLSEFLPKLRKIIKKYKLFATIAGHMGDGNFHIIPLMNIEMASERAKIMPAMKEVNELVLKYGGSLSGEHNDGLIRGPWLEQMYGPEITGYFKQVKHIFDPDNIFNPHKKTDATWDFSSKHMREKF